MDACEKVVCYRRGSFNEIAMMKKHKALNRTVAGLAKIETSRKRRSGSHKQNWDVVV